MGRERENARGPTDRLGCNHGGDESLNEVRLIRHDPKAEKTMARVVRAYRDMVYQNLDDSVGRRELVAAFRADLGVEGGEPFTEPGMP